MNFYKEFTEELIKQMCKSKKYDCTNIHRPRLSSRGKVLCIYEKINTFLNVLFRFLTKSLITKDKIDVVVVNGENYFLNNLSYFEKTFLSLNDEESQKKFIHYVAFRFIGSFSSRLKFHWDEFKQNMKIVDSKRKNNIIHVNEFNYPVNILSDEVSSDGMVILFIDEQYAYKDIVGVSENDVVIDCGGANGDTAMYFCAKGAKDVYIYEFINSSIDKINKHIEVNPTFRSKIHIIEKAVWSISNLRLSYIDNGNASQVGKENEYPYPVKTLSIDNLVEAENIQKVDFIKMDIEGAEVSALEGAKKTIQKYKPKLAISVYHKSDDLITIPTLIKQYNPSYRFFFDYYTNTGAEAVLYAIDPSGL